MGNGLLISVPHTPLPGLLFPQNIFSVQLTSTPQPSIQIASTLYLSYCFFHYLNQTFLLIRKIGHNFLLQPAIPGITPLLMPYSSSHASYL